jgi:2-keto-3-deoxy-L-rhamnonate aldolase RhmA
MIGRQNTLKRKLAEGRATVGLWVTLESPSISEIAVTLGYDWIVIDAEHGHLDFKEIQDHVRVTRNTPTTPLVRIAEIQQGLIKRVLDMGAEGILVPQVYSAAEVAQAVRFAKYPPWGMRGVGGERATAWGLDLRDATRVANDQVMVIPFMETVAAGEVIDTILDVKGVDAIYFGPADYSSSAGHLGEWEGPGVAECLVQIKDRIRARGVPCGIMSRDSANARVRREQGFQMIGLGSDTGFIIGGSLEAMKGLDITPRRQ